MENGLNTRLLSQKDRQKMLTVGQFREDDHGLSLEGQAGAISNYNRQKQLSEKAFGKYIEQLRAKRRKGAEGAGGSEQQAARTDRATARLLSFQGQSVMS